MPRKIFLNPFSCQTRPSPILQPDCFQFSVTRSPSHASQGPSNPLLLKTGPSLILPHAKLDFLESFLSPYEGLSKCPAKRDTFQSSVTQGRTFSSLSTFSPLALMSTFTLKIRWPWNYKSLLKGRYFTGSVTIQDFVKHVYRYLLSNVLPAKIFSSWTTKIKELKNKIWFFLERLFIEIQHLQIKTLFNTLISLKNHFLLMYCCLSCQQRSWANFRIYNTFFSLSHSFIIMNHFWHEVISHAGFLLEAVSGFKLACLLHLLGREELPFRELVMVSNLMGLVNWILENLWQGMWRICLLVSNLLQLLHLSKSRDLWSHFSDLSDCLLSE